MYLNDFGGYKMDISTYTMLLTCKLMSLAFCYHDGGVKDKEKNLNETQRQWQVVDLPTVLEYASFVFYCNACALGVFIEFSEYKRFIEMKGEYMNIPNTIIPTLKNIAYGMLCFTLYVLGTFYFPFGYCFTEEYDKELMWYKIFYLYMAFTLRRFFYHCAFQFTTAANVSCGLGYNGVTEKGEHRWDKYIGIYTLACETTISINEFLRDWNNRVHKWLKHYVMERLNKPGERPSASSQAVVFIVSAFWHGFYPCYYLAFFMALLLTEVSKDLYKSWILFAGIPKPVRLVLSHFLTMLVINYGLGVQMAITGENTLNYLKNTRYCVLIALVGTLILIKASGMVRIAQKMQKKKEGDKSTDKKVDPSAKGNQQKREKIE